MSRMLALVVAAIAVPALAVGPPLATVTVQPAAVANVHVAEGVVEAVRQSSISAQVPARVVEMGVRAGDVVRAGQVLVRLDSRVAADQVAASQAQAGAARAQLDAARKEYERSERLFAKRYISQAAMDQAEAQFKAADAQARATLAQAGLAATQSTFMTVVAPYAAVVATVSIEQGDLASPGVPLLTLYDPAQMRVVASIPDGRVSALDPARPVRIEIAGVATDRRPLEAVTVQVLPTSDPATHTRQVRLTLPSLSPPLSPGMFARVQFPLTGAAAEALGVPARTIVRRPEFSAVYVIGTDGRAQLRQVRLGRTSGDQVEVLAGLAPGERIALDPVAAARQ